MSATPRRFAIAVLALAPIGLAACSGDDIAERITEEAIESQTGGEIDIDTDGDGSFSVETEDGSFSIGGGEVPENWPSDVPLPDGFEVLSGSEITQSDGDYVNVTGNVDASPAELAEFYKDELSDWTVAGDATSTMNGLENVNLQLELDDRSFSMNASSSDGEPTTLTVTHITQASE